MCVKKNIDPLWILIEILLATSLFWAAVIVIGDLVCG